MGVKRREGPGIRFMQELAEHMLSHKPASVCVEDWWISTLHVHADQAILALEAEKWRLPLGGEAHEPRLALQGVMRLGLVGMAMLEHYRAQVGAEWFDAVGCQTSLLSVQYTLRHLAGHGLLPGYSKSESPHEGSGADA